MFEIFLIEGQDYGGFPRVEFLLFMPGCQSKEGMLQNIWNAGLLTGGLSMQREPMSTSLHPTPDALRPAARHQRRFTEHIVFPSKLLPSAGSSWRGNFQEKFTVQSFAVPRDPPPRPRLYLSYLQAAGGGVKDYFLREASSGRRAKSSSTLCAPRLRVHARLFDLINIGPDDTWSSSLFTALALRDSIRKGLN